MLTFEDVLVVLAIATLQGETAWPLFRRDDRQFGGEVHNLDDKLATLIGSFGTENSVRYENYELTMYHTDDLPGTASSRFRACSSAGETY